MQEIPYIDIRHSTPIALAQEERKRALSLLHAGKYSYGVLSQAASGIALPLGDGMARRWLEKTKNPYRQEIDGIAQAVGAKGIFALNLSYEWGCTCGVFETSGAPRLVRVLDWPFPGLGEHAVVAHQQGSGGAFYNVTWPGVSGVFQAMAPGRFAAALNQAPMRRYMTGIALDWLRNRTRMLQQDALPPAHLLRQVFEEATSYDEAKRRLMHTPICLPVIYVLTGTQPGEGCIIERTETEYAVRELLPQRRIAVANHFSTRLNGLGAGWMPRSLCAGDSHGRELAMEKLETVPSDKDTAWFKAPIANSFSRLIMVADARGEKFMTVGIAESEPVTQPHYLNAEAGHGQYLSA